MASRKTGRGRRSGASNCERDAPERVSVDGRSVSHVEHRVRRRVELEGGVGVESG
jgi:hypothetical protein